MIRRRVVVGLALALVNVPAVAQIPAAPAPSAPASSSGPAIARCRWTALPDRTRAALIASGPSLEDIGKAISGMSPTLLDLARSQCPAPTTPQIEAASKEAWAGVVITSWAEGELAQRFGVTPAALARAWARVSPAERHALAAGFDKTPEATRASVASFAAELRLTDPAALDLLSAWAIAELRLSALE
ncbi:MAG TPA: hypothetical protein VFE13_09715 [Caulobacteraceae bacterium]|jgi:hypothetical protein|nr:hypothetical protein [Caulobacteraceae bacterium]